MSSSVLAATTATTATTNIAWTERTADILSLGLLDNLNMMTGATRSSSSFNCITITLLLIPTIIIALYFYTAFPTSPESVVISPGLGSLLVPTPSGEGGKVGERVREIYGEDFWERRVEGMGVSVEGGYVQLPLGRTRYWILGPRDVREQLVLIHGLSVPSIIWTDVAPALAQKGYRVLVYDLYSRGYTSAPHTTHFTSLYTTQLALLLQYLGPSWSSGSLNLVGISMGGGIAAAFAVQFPHLVNGRVALLASAGVLEAGDMSRTSRFLSSPLMQLVSSTYPFRVYLRHLARTGNSSVDTGDRISELVRIQSAHLQGYNSALASSIRDGPVRNLAPVYAQLGRLVKKARASSSSSTLSSPSYNPTPTHPNSNSHSPTNRTSTHKPEHGWREDSRILLVWGTKDRVVPFRYAERVLTLVGGEVGWQEGFPCSSSLSSSSSSFSSSSTSSSSSSESESSSPLNEFVGPLTQEVLGGGRKEGRDGWSRDQHARLVTIEGAGHGLTESHAELVVRLLDGFFAGR